MPLRMVLLKSTNGHCMNKPFCHRPLMIPIRILCTGIILIVSLLAQSQETQTIHFTESVAPLRNPLKGWVVWGEDHDQPPQPSTLFFSYRSWRELEPQEGVWDFESWETDIWQYWIDQGMKGILRVYVDYPGRQSGMPQWLVDQGIRLTEYPQYNGGFSPDYTNPLFIEKAEILIQKLGERYNNDPRVAFVDVGILGHWGEWHTYPTSHLFARRNVQQRVVEAYQKYMPEKKTMLRYPEPWTALLSVGYRDDCFYSDTDGEEDWQFFRRIESANATEVWKTQPYSGEFCGGGSGAISDTLEDPEKCIRLLREGHFSHLGPAGGTMRARDDAHQATIDTMLKTMGYRYVLRQAQMVNQASAGESITVQLRIENTGSAPFYYPWKMEAVWLDESGLERSRTALDTDIRTLLPGIHDLKFEITVPSIHANQNMQLAVEIPDPSGLGPSIQFANEGKHIERRFVVAAVKVQVNAEARDWKLK